MATTYKKNKRVFSLRWTDFVKKEEGVKDYYGRKQISWKGKKAPSKDEIEALIEEYNKICDRNEAESKRILEAMKGDKDGVIYAADFFENVPEKMLCKNVQSKSQTLAKTHAGDFAKFIRSHFPNLKLHEIREKHVTQYLKTLSEQTYGSIYNRLNRLAWIMKCVLKEYDEIDLPYRNPFEGYNLTQIKPQKFHRKETLNANMMREFYQFSKTRKICKSKKAQELQDKIDRQLNAIIYFLCVTGWRVGDVVTLKWSNFDLNEKIVTIVHHKTEKDGTRTKICITPIMEDLLLSIKDLSDGEYLFPVRKRVDIVDIDILDSGKKMVQKFVKKFRVAYNLLSTNKNGLIDLHTFSTHSIRGSVIQELSNCDFNVEKVNYLTGHSNGSINSTNYLRFECDAIRTTKNMIMHLERIIGADFVTDEARARYHREVEQEQLSDLRKGLSATQGGFYIGRDGLIPL